LAFTDSFLGPKIQDRPLIAGGFFFQDSQLNIPFQPGLTIMSATALHPFGESDSVCSRWMRKSV
jgi:hypothetical protein